ncbi:putative holin-like toxin [Paenibacillus chartarius]|uniref:Holin-like toxin n=1 Tax=Paenibacillus chartarius TaxID=747481 RepID=A0ABV6DSB5_9BACL
MCLDVKDALTLMISSGVLLVAILTLVVNIVVALTNRRK